MKSFADLGVSRPVVDVLTGRGITAPFPVQSLVVNDVLEGRDVLVKSPTGSGKTLAFGIPIVERLQADGPRPAALVLAPTRELASQIVEEIRAIAHARALRVTAVYGGVGLTKQAQSAAKSHIVVATPGRLEDLLDRKAFSLAAVRMLVLDEADRMLDMGFRPAIDRIIAACPQDRQTLFFSATLDGEAGRVAARYAQSPVVHEHGPKARRANAEIEHRFVQTSQEHRVQALV
ncbi:MAG TPA: DEAD/DEAH box helicase, partial [Solirubrobacteraceae bacterium]|nr:DEAD/DEAH box helicase [Solirubrobacteraceae bacterium]